MLQFLHHGVPFETYLDALLAWECAIYDAYKYADKFRFLPEGRERVLGRELWLEHTKISDACYAEVVRLRPPPSPLAPPFCKFCQYPSLVPNRASLCGTVPGRH